MTRVTAAHAPPASSVGESAEEPGAERANHERQGEEPVDVNQ